MMFLVLFCCFCLFWWLLCVCVLVVLQVCGKYVDEVVKFVVLLEVEFVVVQCIDVLLVIELFGCLEFYCMVEVCVCVDGIVFKCVYEEGQVVKVGQVLFCIDLVLFKVQVDVV